MFKQCLVTHSQWHRLQTFQTLNKLLAVSQLVFAGAASASSGSGAANSWNLDIAVAPQTLGPSGPLV